MYTQNIKPKVAYHGITSAYNTYFSLQIQE